MGYSLGVMLGVSRVIIQEHAPGPSLIDLVLDMQRRNKELEALTAMAYLR